MPHRSQRSSRLGFASLAALTTLPLVLAGCANSSDPSSGGSETITVWMKKQLFDSQNAGFQERADAFEEETGIEVDLEVIAYEDFYAKWAAAIESGAVPDVSFFGYQEVGQFYAQGVLAPVTDVVDAVEGADGPINENLKSAVTFDGDQFGVPFWSEAQAMYYRTDLFDAAGVDVPETWDEYRDAAEELTDGSTGVYGAGIGFSQKNSDAEFFARTVAWSYGGSLDASPDDYSGLEDATADSIDYVKSIFDDGSVPADALSWDDAGNNRSYLAGQSATVFNAGSLLATIETENPDLFANTGIAPFPAGPEAAVSPGIMNTLGIFDGANNAEGAKQFIEFLLDKDWYDTWTSDGAPLTIPVFDDLRTAGVWADGNNAAFAESVDNATFLGSPSSYSPAAGTAYNNRLVNKMYQDILINNQSVDTALSSLRDEIDDTYADQQ